MSQTSWSATKRFVEHRSGHGSVGYYKDLVIAGMMFVVLSEYLVDKDMAMAEFNDDLDVRVALTDPVLRLLYQEMGR